MRLRELKRCRTGKDFFRENPRRNLISFGKRLFFARRFRPERGTITYAASPHEKPILSSGVPLRNWAKAARESTETSCPSARIRVWVADLPQGL